MPVIVHNGTDHVEQKRRALCGNKISCRRRSMVGAKAAPPLPPISDRNQEEDNCSEGDSETDDQSYFPPEVYAQTWQGYITHFMHVVLHCLVFTSYIDCHLLTCLLYTSNMSPA